jgi:Pectate lyase superfamily protein
MASAIDPSKPADGVPAVKADLRANLLAAKNEIEALQTIAAASVKQFGATGNGVTDDTAAIQAAIDATAAAGGGMVFFPAGVYVISASINFKANVTCEGEFGGTMIEMADNAHLNGMFVSSGAIPFFGLRNMILNGNRSGQSGFPGTSVGLRLAHATTSPAFGNNSLIDSGNEINDPYARFENVVVVAVDGIGIQASGAACHFHNIVVIGCHTIGISTSINDAVWMDCTVGGCAHEGWLCFAGSGRYYACKAFFVGTGFNPSNGTYGNYANGVGFRITNGNQFFIGCEGQDTDGPAFRVQGSRVLLSGCYASQASNLTGTSANIGQNPLRGGGWIGKRSGFLIDNNSGCVVTGLVRDRLIDIGGGANKPNLDCALELRSGASDNLVVVGGDRRALGTNEPWVDVTNLSAYSQANQVLTPRGPWRPVRTLSANDTAPLVFGDGIFVTSNNASTTITDFDLVQQMGIGEEFTLHVADNNTTVQNGANIVTKSGANITAQGVYRFLDVGGVWREV